MCNVYDMFDVLQDRIILADTTFLPILGRIWQQLPLLEAVVVLTDRYGLRTVLSWNGKAKQHKKKTREWPASFALQAAHACATARPALFCDLPCSIL